jgi:hypothetical protein
MGDATAQRGGLAAQGRCCPLARRRCLAEGRGFESLHPLLTKPPLGGGFVVSIENARPTSGWMSGRPTSAAARTKRQLTKPWPEWRTRATEAAAGNRGGVDSTTPGRPLCGSGASWMPGLRLRCTTLRAAMQGHGRSSGARYCAASHDRERTSNRGGARWSWQRRRSRISTGSGIPSQPRERRSESSMVAREHTSSSNQMRATGSGRSSTGIRRAGRASSQTQRSRGSFRKPGSPRVRPSRRSSSASTTPSLHGSQRPGHQVSVDEEWRSGSDPAPRGP